MRWPLALLLVLCCLGTPSSASREQRSPSDQPTDSSRYAEVEQQMWRLANVERIKAGVHTVQFDTHLRDAAREHAHLMAERKQLSHQFEGEQDVSGRVAKQGVRFDAIAENVALTSVDPPGESSHQDLMNSPGHRANILSPKYNAMGVGVVKGPNDIYYIAEDFAHAYEPLDAAQAYQDVLRGINTARGRSAGQRLHVQNREAVNRMTCDPAVKLNDLLAAADRSRGGVLYTTWDPETIPQDLHDFVEDASYSDISLKVCSMPVDRGGSGGFRISVIFF